jgi:hypothetical protein
MTGSMRYLSRRGRLPLLATFLLLTAMMIAAPGVSSARAAVKQFTATISPTTATGGVAGSWTETVTNCGSATTSPCTASSTIGLGTIRIAVPSVFRPITSVSATSPNSRNWTVSYDSGTGNINAFATSGSDKLQPGETVNITFGATPSTCATGDKTFTTSAWGSTPSPGSDPFTLVSPQQPTVTVSPSGSCLESGGTATGPDGQTETVSGGFTGHVIVTFGGDLSCANDPAYGTQWVQYHLPSQVNITPGADFVAGTSPKVSTSTFPAAEGVDSSWYLICYAVPTAGHTAFATRGGGTAGTQSIGGTDYYVGILPNCYNATTGGTRPEPCVSEQYMTLDSPHMVVISTRMPPGDPLKH